MGQEEKELLLKDLCARLPYFLKVNIKGDIETLDSWADDDGNYFNFTTDGPESNFGEGFTLDDIRPYLRLMSSITEEEFQELHSICPHSTFNKTNVSGWIIGIDGSKYGRISRIDEISKLIDWLNSHHFDCRGLIEKNLALEAPEGMYKEE